MSVEECDCENQTEIIIPIKNERYDKDLFQDSIRRQLSYFRNMKYVGIDGPNNVETLYEDQYCIILKNPPIQHCHLVLGNVAYELDYKVLGIDMTSYGGHDKGLRNCGVGLKFDIGELQPTLSRESIWKCQ